MTTSWMRELARHYGEICARNPRTKLMIVFDIDGTILDMRHMIVFVLQSFDRTRGTSFFRRLKVSDVDVHEDHVESLLARFPLPEGIRNEVMTWYLKQRWSSDAIFHSHRPFAGIMEVIRWFQLQPDTFVGLNTGRPEALRKDTLASLNRLGEEYRVRFEDDLLYMNSRDWGRSVPEEKVAGIEHFRARGYKIFAMVDNEPENLRAISEMNDPDILLLHADTIFQSRRARIPRKAVAGAVYELTELISPASLPTHVQFVWHGVNDEANLRQFLASEIHWAEMDVRVDPLADILVLRHDSFTKVPLGDHEELLPLDRCLRRLRAHGRGAKLDLEEKATIRKVLEVVEAEGFGDSDLWFNGNVERLQEEGFRSIAAAHPAAIIQCPIDFLVPLIAAVPDRAREVLAMLGEWGINRYSVSWMTPDKRRVLDRLDSWGLEINLYQVTDLASFLQAVLLLPRSITSDFNFPTWQYYGRGSGESLRRYEYALSREHGAP